MADPATLAAISIGTTVAAGGVEAFGNLSGGAATSRMHNYRAGIADMNSRIAKQNADYTRNQGEVEARRSGMKTAETVSKQKTIQSGSGLDVNFGSTAAVRDSTSDLGYEDQTTIRETAARRAYGYEVEAENLRTQAGIERTSGSNAKKSALLKTLGTVLGTASSVSGKWQQGGQAGLWGRGTDDGTRAYGPGY